MFSIFMLFFFLRIRRPPGSTRTDTLFPYTTLFRSSYDRGGLLEYMDLPDSAAFAAWRNNWQSRIERDIAECREGLINQFTAHEEQGKAVEFAKQWEIGRAHV